MTEERRVVTRDGVGLAVRVVGGGDEAVLVPGAASDEDLLDLVAPDRTLVFVDSRNRGRSDRVDVPSQLGFSLEVDDLEAVRGDLDLDEVSLIGSSYLAGVVAHYAREHPDHAARLVLVAPIGLHAGVPVSPNPEPPPHLLARLDQLEAEGLKDRDPAAHCREWRSIYVAALLADPERFVDMRSDPCDCPNEWPDHMMRAMAHVLVDLGEWDWRGTLSRVTAPVLVVHGTADTVPVWAVQEWIDELPVARRLPVEGAARMPWIEQPELFHAAVDTFLRGAWPEGAR
jgi:pimeloyl-ACP methyl ester carboxylesterase